MPDISLLEQRVLNGVIKKMQPKELMAAKIVKRSPYPFATVEYDVVYGSSDIAKPNVPNSEAHIVGKRGVGKVAHGMLYSREKKPFEPTTLYWLREPGEWARNNAEKTVMDELEDLVQRTERLVEYCIWKVMTGSLNLNLNEVKANINYLLRDTHKPESSVDWDAATGTDIIGDLRAWKRLLANDGGVTPSKVYLNSATLDTIVTSAEIKGLLSDDLKNEYFKTGTLKGFQELTWIPYDNSVYIDEVNNGFYIPEGKIILTGETFPVEILEGPSADADAPRGTTGRFAKSWKEKDPSADIALVEYTFFPKVSNADAIVYADVYTPKED